MQNRLVVASVLLLLAGCRPSPLSEQKAGLPADSADSKPVDDLSPPVTAEPADAAHVDLQILDLDGIQKLIESHHGKVVVMDAWSTSCAPCIREFPKLVALSRKYGPDRLACISLSFDYEGDGTPQEQVPHVRAFLERQGATFDNVLSSEDSDTLRRKFALASIPAVFVYDRGGELRKRFDNDDAQGEADAFSYKQVGELVAELVAEETPSPNGGEAAAGRR